MHCKDSWLVSVARLQARLQVVFSWLGVVADTRCLFCSLHNRDTHYTCWQVVLLLVTAYQPCFCGAAQILAMLLTSICLVWQVSLNYFARLDPPTVHRCASAFQVYRARTTVFVSSRLSGWTIAYVFKTSKLGAIGQVSFWSRGCVGCHALGVRAPLNVCSASEM